MSTKLRLTRHGAKKKPFYWLIAANSTSPRDGKFFEKLGTYNPMLNKDNSERIKFNKERISHWLSVGAIPSERVEKLLEFDGIDLPKKIKTAKDKKDAVRKLKSEKALAEKKATENAEKKAKEEEEAAATAKEKETTANSDGSTESKKETSSEESKSEEK